MVMNLDSIVGVCFLLYGIFKITISVLSFTLPRKVLAWLQKTILRLVITDDRTVAGRAFDGVLLVYAAYSIMHGLTLLRVAVPLAGDLFRSARFKILFYNVLGVFVTTFYALVLLTDVPISKKKREYGTYRLYLLAGIIFLLTAALVPRYGKWM